MLGAGATTCTSATRTATVATINPLPAATIGSNAPVCTGATLNLTSSGGVSYSWTGPNSFTSSSQNPSIPSAGNSNAGTYTVIVTNATPCSLAVSTVIAISPLPVVTSSSVTPNPICAGSTLGLNSAGTAGFIGYSVAAIPYAPQTGGTPISPTSGDDFVSASIPLGFSFSFYGTVYTNLFVYTNGFVQLGTSSGSTFVYGQTIPNVAAPNNIIAGVFEDLNPAVGAITYFTTGTAPNQVFNIRYNNVPYFVTNGNTNFQIQLFESTNVIEVHVFENADGGTAQTATLGIENAAGNSAVSPAGHNGVYFPVSNAGAHEGWRFTPAGVTYSWTGPNSFTSNLDNTTIPSITAPAAGLYTVTLTNTLGCTTSASATLVVSPSPTATITASGPTTFCSGNNVTLDAGGPFNSYLWSTGATTQTISATTSGSYTVTVTNAALCSTTSAATVITVNPSPTGVTAVPSTTSVCLPGSIDLAGTGTSTGATTFAWVTTPSGFTSSTQSPTGIAPPVGANTYTLTATDPNNLCTTSVSTPAVNVGTNTSAIITFAGSTTICANNTLNLVASTPSAATLSYQWFLNAVAIGGATNVTYSPTATGDYSVQINEVPSPNCTSTSSPLTVTVNPIPVLTGTANNILCFGGGTGSAIVSATGIPSFSYSWNTSPPQVTDTITNLMAGTYIVNVTDGNNCADTAWVTITQPSSAVSVNAGVDVTLCSGSSTIVSATGTGGTGAIAYTWNNGATQGGSVTPASTTTYTVTATDANSCAATDAVLVTVNPGATVNAGMDLVRCSLSAITLGGSIGGGATLGTWSGVYAGTFSSITNPTGTYTPNPSEAGSTLTLTLTTNDPDGAGPCLAVSDNVAIAISNLVANAGADVAFCGSGTTTLTGTSTGGTGVVGYVWNNGATQGGSVSPASTTTYTVTATDANSCMATDAVVVAINPGATVNAGADITTCGLGALPLGGTIGGSATMGTWSGTYAGMFSSLTNPTGTYTPNLSEIGSTLTLTLTTNDPDGAGPCLAAADNVNIVVGGYATTLAPPIASATPWIADYENTDVFNWTHYYDNAGTPTTYCDDYIILSVQNANTGGNAIGHIGDPGFVVKVAGQGAYTLTNATTPYVSVGVTWYLMGRYWEATPVTQPVNDLNVKFYFTNADFNAVNSVSPYVTSSPTQMAFYKINNGVGGTPAYNPDPNLLHAGIPVASPYAYNGTGYWQYMNGGTASTATWAYSTMGADHVAEYTIDRFSGGGGGGGTNNPGAFPVELLSFTGYNHGDENILEWTTTKEINNKEFVLMRSLDNITFQSIETVPTSAPNGLSYTEINYQTKDLDFGDKTYYRLQQIDIDGQSHLYSNVVEININRELNTVVSLYPNPAKEVLNVSITQPQGGKHKVEIYDAIGKLVSVHKADLKGGNTVMTLDVSELAKGTYIIMVKNADNGTVATNRFVKE